MLERLKREIIDGEPEACLPTNLSDEWLAVLASSADASLGNEQRIRVSSAACMAVLFRLVNATSGRDRMSEGVPSQEMLEYAVKYRMELALEELHRNTTQKYEPATMQTILAAREVKTWIEI
jgi:hypothetical protein